PFFAAGTTINSPIKPPNMAGNSGPRKLATNTYGIVMASEANIANFHTCKPSLNDLFFPKNLVKSPTKNNGTNIPARAWIIASFPVTLNTKADTSEIWVSGSTPEPTPTTIGVPTAPNETGVL